MGKMSPQEALKHMLLETDWEDKDTKFTGLCEDIAKLFEQPDIIS